MSRIRSNRICFTLNNYEQEDADAFERWFCEDTKIRYGICGQEIGENGTPHLQGFIHYDEDRKKCGIKWWKSILPGGQRAHFETARGTDEDSAKYCSKEGVYIECGTPTKETNMWAEIFETAKIDLEAALAINPEVSIKHYFQIKKIHDDYQTQQMDCKIDVLRDWQNNALQKLQLQSDRQVLFIVDEQGGKGKSMLAKHLLSQGNAWACQGGKIADLMHTYDTTKSIAIFDMARCNNPDYYPWNFMENLKNGWFTSTKYNGGFKVFVPPKIIVFTNVDPPRDKLSSDRYQIYKI